MEVDLVGSIIESLMKDGTIPEDIDGVWTASDDKALNAREASSRFQDMLMKHGDERVEKRRKYFRDTASESD
ncbi:hypothetical protein G7Y89_g393 [Cudoniella acicularis]|uniref:TRF2-interacting telomeric protein/Rap1 C-terminal domain-containing protein n=1 Tax=Cudoniella acicularis TaxID=354080 RepID=A0A8H4RZ87_9HELO|nr:hypothetical protein G7Y89_g393 [Cudoniella acicularis]